jgi:hypothetical protein
LTNRWPIETGISESAADTRSRISMAITGAHWGLTDAEAILKLRTGITNGDFCPAKQAAPKSQGRR